MPGRIRRWGQRLGTPLWLALCVGAPAGVLQLAGPAAGAGAAVLAWGAAWLATARATARAAAGDTTFQASAPTPSGFVEDTASATRHEAARLTSQVVPVWQRNIDAARSYSEQSMATLLESFSGVTSHLDQALGEANDALQLDVGATDTLMAQHDQEVRHLTARTQAAMHLKDAMHDELLAVATALADMARQTREVQSVARVTHLLALNASVEANRSQAQAAGAAAGQGSGFMVVAEEIRRLAGQSRTCGDTLARQLAELQARLGELDLRFRREHTESEEIDASVEQAARQVVASILASMSGVTRASRQLRLAGHQVKTDIDKIFVSLQSQDRTSQMLGSVTDDMQRYARWLHGEDDPAATNPADWLERLDRSYTMEDLRSAHHGTVSVQQNSSVEFF